MSRTGNPPVAVTSTHVAEGLASRPSPRPADGSLLLRQHALLPTCATEVEDVLDPAAPTRARTGAVTSTVVLLCAVVALVGTIGGDARWLAAMGAAILEARSVPDGVPFASAESSAWHNVPVLAEVLFATLDAIAGDRGLLLAQVLSVAVALTAVAVDARRQGASQAGAAAALTALFLACATTFLIVRLQLFSVALFPLLVLLLRAEAARPSRRVWLVVPLLALWSNLHGGALVGLAVTGAYLLLHRARTAPGSTTALLAACGAAMCITPATVDTPSYYFHVLTGEAAEGRDGMWARLSLESPFDVTFLLLASIAAVAFLRRRPATWQLVAAAGLTIMTVQAARHGVWLMLFLAPPAAASTGRAIRSVPSSAWNVVLTAATAALALGLLQGPGSAGAGAEVSARALDVAGGAPVMAEGVLAEQVAQDGGRIWMGNPLDAFSRGDQRAYLGWMRTGRMPAGGPGDVVLVVRGGAADQLLRGASSHRLVTEDTTAALYVLVDR